MRTARYKKKAMRDHGDDWLMTYADMITLLLCFFAIFLSVSVPKKDNAAKMQRPPVEADVRERDVMQGAFDAKGATRIVFTRAEEADAELPASLGGASVEQLGDTLTIIEVSTADMFTRNATLSDAGKTMLADLAKTMQAGKYKGSAVSIESHTDDTAPTSYPSNWELSTSQSGTILRFFLEHGVAAQKLRAAGYADAFPKQPNRDYAGKPLPENKAGNRRIVIKLEKDTAG